MTSCATTSRKILVLPSDLETKTYSLSPNDIITGYAVISLAWPTFFNYDLDGDRLEGALGKLLEKYPILCGRVRAHEDLRYVIEVDPSKEDCYGVPFIEQSSDMSVATALLEHSKLKADSGNFPVFPQSIPFYIETSKAEKLLKGEEPVMKLKLTHFSDGCAVSVAVQHMLVDGQRYVEACRDLSRAYRGIEIPDRDHDRSYLWPDHLAKFFPFLGEDVAKLPRKVLPSGDEYSHPQYPDDTGETHVLLISEETLKRMKDTVKPFLKGDEYVSSNDVISAFIWMLECEFLSDKQPVLSAADLDLEHTFCFSTFEVLKNGIDVIPENYAGNAFITPLLMNQGLDMDSNSLEEAFAKLAILIRKTVLDLREKQAITAQILLAYYIVASTGKFPADLPVDKQRAIMTNMTKAPISEVDYGHGGPVWSHIDCAPLHGGLYQTGPGPGNDGVAVYAQLRGSQASLLKTSVVRKVIAPGMQELYNDVALEELKCKLGLEKQ